MISPFKPPKINSGGNDVAENNLSIWNYQFKRCLVNLNLQLNNAIQKDARRDVKYFMGLITRLQYHPTINWPTIVPFDMLLLQKTPRCLRTGCPGNRKKSQHKTSQRVGTSEKKKKKSHRAGSLG